MFAVRLYRKHGGEFTRDAFVYEVTPPVQWRDFDFETDKEVELESSYVWVSSIAGETYAFPCNWCGEVINWAELDMSKVGDWHPDAVLTKAGYAIEEASHVASALIRVGAYIVRSWRSSVGEWYDKVRK
jgi:hypothetical protein